MKDTLLSILRHAATLAGGWLLAKGYIGDNVAQWLPGALFILAGGIWGAVDELRATGQRLHFWLSAVRHTLTAAGGYCTASGIISAETVTMLIGAILAVLGSIWGITDEATYNAERPGN